MGQGVMFWIYDF